MTSIKGEEGAGQGKEEYQEQEDRGEQGDGAEGKQGGACQKDRSGATQTRQLTKI